jgi:hypothetical protein
VTDTSNSEPSPSEGVFPEGADLDVETNGAVLPVSGSAASPTGSSPSFHSSLVCRAACPAPARKQRTSHKTRS